MKVVYLFEPDIKNKYYILLEKLKDFYLKSNKFIHFVPTIYKKIFLEEKILNFYNINYLFLPEIHTPLSFCDKFIKPLIKKQIISHVQGYVIFHSLLKKNKELLEIFYKKDEKKEIHGLEAFSKKLFETYLLIKNYASFKNFSEILKLKEINDFLENYPHVEKKISVSFYFFDEFESFLENKNFIIDKLILKEAINYIDNFEFDYIVIDSFLDFTEIEKRFFEKIIDISKNVFVSFENYNLEKEKEGEILERTIEFYKEKGFEFVEIKGGEKRRKEIYFYKFASRDEEVEEICKKIIYEKVKNNKNFSDFIISFPNLKEYSPFIERTFYLYGVPYHLTLPKDLLSFQETKIIFSILDVYIRKFSYNSFINFVTSPLILKKGKFKIFKEIISKYARIANCLIGREYWEKMIEIIKELKKEREYEKEIDEKEIEILKECLKEIFEVLKDIDLDEKNKIDEWVEWIKNILNKFGYFEDLNDIKIHILNKIDEILEFSEFIGEITIYEFKNLLLKIFEDEEIEKSLKEKNGVKIIGLFELLGIENETIFFGGMNDGDFPKIIETHFLIPDKIKRALNIPDRKEIIRRDKINFERIKNNFDEIIFTYPCEDDERVLLPSPFIENLENVKEGFEEIKKYFIGEPERQIEIGERMGFDLLENFGCFELNKKKFKKNIERFFPKRKINVTQLVSYKKCPFKFYLENIIECTEIEEPTPAIKGVIIGRIIHNFMQRFINEFKKTNYDFNRFEEKYEFVLKQVIKDFRIPPAFKIYFKYYIEYLEEFIKEKERKRKENNFLPLYLEYEVKAKRKNFTILGKIDRIDYSLKENIYEIIDYKTGSKTYSDEFQLYIYLRLAKETGIIEKDAKTKILIYSFEENSAKSKWEEELKMEDKEIDDIIYGIENGDFEPKPYKDECKNCNFKNFCPLWIKKT
jgi:ATP-dependent helicase/DNAse subunit B